MVKAKPPQTLKDWGAVQRIRTSGAEIRVTAKAGGLGPFLLSLEETDDWDKWVIPGYIKDLEASDYVIERTFAEAGKKVNKKKSGLAVCPAPAARTHSVGPIGMGAALAFATEHCNNAPLVAFASVLVTALAKSDEANASLSRDMMSMAEWDDEKRARHASGAAQICTKLQTMAGPVAMLLIKQQQLQQQQQQEQQRLLVLRQWQLQLQQQKGQPGPMQVLLEADDSVAGAVSSAMPGV